MPPPLTHLSRLPELLRASETTTGDRAADEIERLRTDLDRGAKDYCALRDREDALTVLLREVTASLAAAISLLECGSKKAAPSEKMFDQMLRDYKKSLDHARSILKP
jgi:hypothetical protein